MAESQYNPARIVIGDDLVNLSIAIDRRKTILIVGCRSTVETEGQPDLVTFAEVTLSYDEAAALSNIISAWLSGTA